jgi:hypothetical protein
MVKRRSPKVKDPVMEIKDLQLSKDSWAGMYNMHDVGMILTGILLLAGFLGNWVTYFDRGIRVELDGFHFARDAGVGPIYPMVWFVPLIGALLILRPVLAAYQRRSTYISVWPHPAISLVLCLVTMLVPMLVANTLNASIQKAPADGGLGIQFWNNAGVGFFLVVGASLGGIFVAVSSFIEGFLAKGPTQKALRDRAMKYGAAAGGWDSGGGMGGSMVPAPPPDQAMPAQQGGWDQSQQAGGYGGAPAQQGGWDQSGGGAGWGQPPPGSPFGPRPADPKAAAKWDKAVQAWQEKQGKGGF